MLIVEGQAHQPQGPREGDKGGEEARLGQRRVNETKEDEREVDPGSLPRNNSQELPGPPAQPAR